MSGLWFEELHRGPRRAARDAQLGLDDVAFPAPVLHGGTVRVETEVVSARASGSRPDAGIVVFEHRAHNQNDDLVCRCRRTGLMHRRPA